MDNLETQSTLSERHRTKAKKTTKNRNICAVIYNVVS